MPCTNSRCRRVLGAIERILSTAVQGRCTDCALDEGLFKEEEG